MTEQDELSQMLRDKVQTFDVRPSDVPQVEARAQRIRAHRRVAAVCAVAAAVLVAVVPTVLAAGGDRHRHVQPAPAPHVDNSPLGLDGLGTGAKPKTGWFDGEVWTGPEGAQVQVSGGSGPSAVARIGDSLLVTTADDSGMRVRLLPPAGKTGKTVVSWPVDGAIAVSDDGRLGAFVQPDGTPVVVEEDGTHHELPMVPRGGGFDAVAVTGGTCAESGANTCDVLVTSHGKTPQTWVSTSSGYVGEHELMSNVVDSFQNRLLAGFTRITDTGSCSAVDTVNGDRESWTTCDHSFLRFSPEGDHLLGTSAYRDGIGDTVLAVLDSATGKVLLDLGTADGAFINAMAWEDDSHVLATVFQGGRWAVVRVDLDGRREYAVGPVAGDEMEAPFVLPTR